jgi:hypothetical protein
MAHTASVPYPAFASKQALLDEIKRIVQPVSPGDYYSLAMRLIHADCDIWADKSTKTEAGFTKVP